MHELDNWTEEDGCVLHTVAEIAETFGVSRKTVYRHPEPSAGAASPVRARGRPHPPGRWRSCCFPAWILALSLDILMSGRKVFPGGTGTAPQS
jgi:hypothetical protein